MAITGLRDIAGHHQHYDFSESDAVVLSSGALVATCKNYSDNVQYGSVSSGFEPLWGTRKVNGKNVLSFPNLKRADIRLRRTPVPTADASYTVTFVLRNSNTDTEPQQFRDAVVLTGSANERLIWISNDGTENYDKDTLLIDDDTGITEFPVVIGEVMNVTVAHGTTNQVWINGVAVDMTTISGLLNTATFDEILLGGHNYSLHSRSFYGDICEVAQWSGVRLTDANAFDIYLHQREKWGVGSLANVSTPKKIISDVIG